MQNVDAGAYFGALGQVLNLMQASDEHGHRVDFETAARSAIAMLDGTRQAGRKVLLVGNGGSASIVGHLQMDLCNANNVRALAFHDAPMLTALANDHGYIVAFERCVRLWAEAGDLVFAISSSGRSENILRAVEAGRAAHCQVITFSGFAPENPLRALGQLNFYAPSMSYGHVEMAHSIFAHYLSDQLLNR